MIKTIGVLKNELANYEDVSSKISNMIKKGELTPIIRGLYETDASVPGYYLASIVYGPSYLSFEFILSHYGLIPESVYHYTSATYNKRRRKKYDTPFGIFSYRDVPKKVFPLAINIHQENGYSYILAKAEKAICDILYIYEPCKNQKELRSLLFDFLRIDKTLFASLDFELMIKLSHYYKTKNHKLFLVYLKKELKKHGDHA
jgi:predicted transcriptional regulator of viral defense system